FAVCRTTEGVDIEWQEYGIRVLDVMPVFAQTGLVKDMDAGSIQNMGVHLTAEDVARAIYARVQVKDSMFTKTHQAVGLKTKVLMTLSKLSPQFLNRMSNRILAKRK